MAGTADDPKEGDTPSLNQDGLKKVQDWFRDKGDMNHHCPVCGNPDWSIEPDLVATLVVKNRKLINTRGYTLLLMFCTKCAHALFFHAGAIGVDATTTPQATPASAPKPEGE